ncbi:helix-turn-helix transcriptional regulator [Leucobacter triazinivorans]|uniref:helix-turn-helix transcriptional regulator n=1 Tax=Leucobacter triazinivorans TaxID=1784719 RepID=UPI001F0FA4C8|nr:helix-turn-helix transcriptional regulator [Leucobacter triazinivorans]
MPDQVPTEGLLRELADVLAAPLGAILPGLSRLLAPIVPHSGMVMLTADVSGGRLQGCGDPTFVSGVRGLDLERLRRGTSEVETVRRTHIDTGDRRRPALQVVARNGALLVLADPSPLENTGLVLDVWNIVSLHVQERADEARPDYLQHARSTSGARLKALAELADEYATTLEALLTALRSRKLSDSEARAAGIARAADGLVRLRAVTDEVRTLTEEPVGVAFDRLKQDLLSAVRLRDLELQFGDPPSDGRPLPDEVARGARAVARRVVLSRIDIPEVTRIRVQWNCDGVHLLMSVRDDGPGDPADAEMLRRATRRRIDSLNGRLSVDATPGWGTELSAVLPLDPPRAHLSSSAISRLRPREVQVAELLVAGSGNRAIGDRLGVSENTVKFHVSRILRALGVASRSQAIAALLAEQRS